MKTYNITETNGINDTREGADIQASSLANAKTQASRSQFFKGTVLTIRQGADIVAQKVNGKWL